MTLEDISDLTVDPNDSEDIRNFARFLHEEYEHAAADADWDTQAGTSVPFDELPEANQETMESLARRVTRRFLVVEHGEELEALKDDGELRPGFDFEADADAVDEGVRQTDGPGGDEGDG